MEKNRYNSILHQQLYTLSLVIIAVKNILDGSALFHRPEIVDTMLIGLFLVCVCWELLIQKFTIRKLMFVILLGLPFVLVSLRMRYYVLLISYCCIVTMQGINLKNAFKYSSGTKILLILIHVIPYLITWAILPEQIDYVYRNGVQRHYFYISHPNTFSMFVAWTSLEFVYAWYEQLSMKSLGIVWIINYLVYRCTDSNTSMILITMSIALMICERKNKVLMAKIMTPMARYLYAVLAVFFTVITVGYKFMSGPLKMAYLALNDFFTGRLLYGTYAYHKFGMTWLGNPYVTLNKTDYFDGVWIDSLIFDNTYIQLLIYYGAIFLIINSCLFIWLGKDKEKDPSRNLDKLLIICYSFYIIMENNGLNATICFPYLFIGKKIYETAVTEGKGESGC